MNSSTYQQELAKVFDFQPDDLSINRNKQLTSAQIEELKGKSQGFGRAIAVVIVTMIVIAGVALFILNLIDPETFQFGLIYLPILMAIFTIVVIAVINNYFAKFRKDYKEQAVVAESGAIEIVSGDAGTVGKLKVNNTIYDLQFAQFKLVSQIIEQNPSAKITVYSTKYSNRILSLDISS